MKRWRSLLFDLDDTLYAEREYVLSGFGAVAHWAATNLHIEAEAGYAHLQNLYQAGVRGDTFNRWLQHFQIINEQSPPEAIQELLANLVQIYRQHVPNLQPFPEVVGLLKKLQGAYRIGLVSDGYLEVQQRKFAALNLAHYFDGVVFSDQLGRDAWKPSAKPFIEVLRLLGEQPENAVYIGDNPLKDFAGPRRMGMSTIWLRRNGGEYTSHMPPAATHAPDIIVTSWHELQEWL